MRSSIIAGILALAVSRATAQYANQSAPFYLVVLSQNKTINGSALEACHEGAAIEGLCLGGPLSASSSQFTYNTSAESITPEGYLTYELRGGNFNLSSPMDFSYNPTSNVAVPLFTPAESGLPVSFDDCDKLNVPGYIDDTVVPANYTAQTAYYRWYVCNTYVGYPYTTLAWVLGNGVPENPTCTKVDVVRLFV